jgi:hypothetical protein
MCELAIMAVSHTNLADPIKDVRLHKAGDVVVAMPDGWAWGTDELSSPLFMIVKVPSLPLIEGLALCTETQGNLMLNPMLPIRAFKLDLTLLPISLDGVSRKVPFVTLTATQIRGAKAQKAPIANPLVVG